MTQNQETFTRKEVMDLLQTQHEETLKEIRAHFQEERDKKGAATSAVAGGLAGMALGGIILWMIFG